MSAWPKCIQEIRSAIPLPVPVLPEVSGITCTGTYYGKKSLGTVLLRKLRVMIHVVMRSYRFHPVCCTSYKTRTSNVDPDE